MLVEVHVITNAKKRELRIEGTYLKAKITSTPRDGKANAELVQFLADFFGVRKSEIVIEKGQREKRKLVTLPLGEEELRHAIAKAMAQ